MDFEPLNKLLNKKMNRKEFLLHVGAAVVAMSGIAAIIKNITEPHSKSKKSQPRDKQKRTVGYGQSSYGM